MTKLPDKRKFSSIRSVYPVQLCTVPLFVFLYLISFIFYLYLYLSHYLYSYILYLLIQHSEQACLPRAAVQPESSRTEGMIKENLKSSCYYKDKYTDTKRQIHKDTGDDKRGSDPDPSCNMVCYDGQQNSTFSGNREIKLSQ